MSDDSLNKHNNFLELNLTALISRFDLLLDFFFLIQSPAEYLPGIHVLGNSLAYLIASRFPWKSFCLFFTLSPF